MKWFHLTMNDYLDIKFKKDSVLLKVVEFDTSEPLIGANISISQYWS